MSAAENGSSAPNNTVNCDENPTQGLVEMFVNMVQKDRIAQGQCPARRPVFLKPHGMAHGSFRVRADLAEEHRVGLFTGQHYPLWMRFSSDTIPTASDYETTVGVGIKLFDVPGRKILGLEDDTTFDFIMQNMDVFFVDTATDMCAFTKASLIDGDQKAYLDAHPRTAEILDAMKKPVASVLASPYWAIMPFAFGPDQYVKYKLVPELEVDPLENVPADPTYLGADLAERLTAGPARFKFCLQFRTNPATMPLDAATVAWPESESPFVHVADIELPRQDINTRGQPAYGENLAWNIWRVTEEHRPQGSIADARKVVYATSADVRRNANGIALGEPAVERGPEQFAPCADDVIVRAAIHPAIGVMRVGDAAEEYFIGPEVTTPEPEDAGFYHTTDGALKRQAARFRIYGYNAAGAVVRELTASNADIEWTVELANRKADWYRFITAMDIPEMASQQVIRRNADIAVADRSKLAITPGERSITGANKTGADAVKFDNGVFEIVRRESTTTVTDIYLGELQTDDAGRLLVLSGHGISRSPLDKPPFDPDDAGSFNNANDWYDDIADGPVHAQLSIAGRAVPVQGAWVVATPPNYAPEVVGWRTMHDLMLNVNIAAGRTPVPATTSFTQDVLPQLARMSNLQWVNKGFAAYFGKGCPLDFEDPAFIGRLAAAPTEDGDTWGQLRRQVLNAFRPHDPTVNEPRILPWIYGDAFDGELFGDSPRTMLDLPSIQQLHLQRWADGTFIADYDPAASAPTDLSQVPLQDQPAMLDQASMHFCLADAFHPGCEITWPMRHTTMYDAPFRIRERAKDDPEPDFGQYLTTSMCLSPSGPLHGQFAGSITRWMALPWQGDTAYCRSGYTPEFDAFLPTYWPARVPNQVLKEEDYQIVIDTSLPREQRLAAFNRRASWYRFIDEAPTTAKRMERMIATFGQQGIVEQRPGIPDDPDFPPVIFVETLPAARVNALKSAVKLAAAPAPQAAPGTPERRVQDAGWGSQAHLDEAIAMRRRRK